MRLLGSVTSKVLYSFLLGVVLLLTRLLMGLNAPGFWTRWMLLSVLWWGAFRHRHQALGLWGEKHHPRPHAQRAIGRAVGRALPSSLRLVKAASLAADRAESLSTPPERTPMGPPRSQPNRSPIEADEQVVATAQQEQRNAKALIEGSPETRVRVDLGRDRLARILSQQSLASANGDARRASLLGVRAERVRTGLLTEEQALDRAQSLTSKGIRDRGPSRVIWGREQLKQRGRFLDAQAILPAAGLPAAASHGGQRRDYAALAGLVGYAPAEYEELDPHRRRQARAEMDRTLAERRALRGLTAEAELAAERSHAPGVETESTRPFRRHAEEASPVMRDIFEFLDGRKSYLGWGASGPPPPK